MTATQVQQTGIPFVDALIKTALSQLGFGEIPKNSNWGPHVQRYLEAVDIKYPQPWCMAFVYWCVKNACKLVGIENQLYKTGHVLTCWNKTAPQYKKTDQPRPGDIFIMEYSKGRGHTGIVVKVENGKIITIEGNTNDEGSREGYEVAVRERPLVLLKRFIRLV